HHTCRDRRRNRRLSRRDRHARLGQTWGKRVRRHVPSADARRRLIAQRRQGALMNGLPISRLALALAVAAALAVTAAAAAEGRAGGRSFLRTAVAGDATGQRSGFAFASIAALGGSTSTGFSTAGQFAEAPANSWVTGTNPTVRSIYLRLRDVNPAIAGHVYNGAEPGSAMSDLPDQATRVPRGTELV